MRPRTVLLVVVAMIFGAIVTAGVLSATDDDEGGRQPAPAGRITRMEQSGEMHEILEQHRLMLEQMQDSASPAMLQLMSNDPMWQMMRSEDWARMDEQHQADIDRMLGKGQP